MGRTAGTPNKITTEVKAKLDNQIEGLVNSIDISEMNMNQKIKMLQIALQYTPPRLQATLIKEELKYGSCKLNTYIVPISIWGRFLFLAE